MEETKEEAKPQANGEPIFLLLWIRTPAKIAQVTSERPRKSPLPLQRRPGPMTVRRKPLPTFSLASSLGTLTTTGSSPSSSLVVRSFLPELSSTVTPKSLVVSATWNSPTLRPLPRRLRRTVLRLTAVRSVSTTPLNESPTRLLRSVLRSSTTSNHLPLRPFGLVPFPSLSPRTRSTRPSANTVTSRALGSQQTGTLVPPKVLVTSSSLPLKTPPLLSRL